VTLRQLFQVREIGEQVPFLWNPKGLLFLKIQFILRFLEKRKAERRAPTVLNCALCKAHSIYIDGDFKSYDCRELHQKKL
jgi:hypothetical protein